MKNTFLKKAGAVALAAVMAVTFAPVASLNVFAASISTTDKDAVDASSPIDLDDPSIKKIKIATGGTLKIKTKGAFEVDINGQSVEIDVQYAGATVTVTNSKAIKAHGSKLPTVTPGAITTSTSATIVLAGNFIVDRTKKNGANIVYADKQPGAVIGENKASGAEYSGQAAIDAGYLAAAPADSNVFALSGAVKVDKLLSGCFAEVDPSAALGTTITATPDTDTTLQTWTTTFTVPYTTWRNYDAVKGWEGTGRAGKATYTDVRYVAGPESAKFDRGDAAALKQKSDIFDNANKTAIGVGARYIMKASNATAIEIDTDKVVGVTGLDYKFAKDITGKDGTRKVDNNADGYYYAFDPSSYVDEGDAFAVIDGNQYRKVAEDNALVAGMYPAKSFKLIQSNTYTKDDKNKNVVFKLNFAGDADITLEAPDDISIVKEKTTRVVGKTVTDSLDAVFFGAEKFGDDTVKNFPDAQIEKEVKAVDYNVQHVATGVEKTFTLASVDTDATVDRENGIGYYRTVNADTDYDFTFGPTKTITKTFEDNAQSKVTNGIHWNPNFSDGTVYASKEIKTTVKGVNRDVTFLGEISAEATATAADGSKTWEINLADTATNDKAVVAYRLYDGNRGEHIYTYNAKERDMLVAAGWKEETSDIKVLPVDAKTGVTVYRVYNPNNGGAHVFTTNPAEVKMLLDAGWEEGVAVFKTPAAGTANTLPVYRVYNTGSKNGEHQFTTSAAEKKPWLEA